VKETSQLLEKLLKNILENAGEKGKILLRPSRSEAAEGGRGIILMVKLAQRKQNHGVFCMIKRTSIPRHLAAPRNTKYSIN
jgi:hypothetical protein